MENNLVFTIASSAIGAAGIVLAAVVSKRRIQINERDSIRQDIEIYNLLPKNSSSRQDLLKRIDENIQHFLIADLRVRRDYDFPVMLLAALLVMIVVLPLMTKHKLVNEWEYWMFSFVFFLVFMVTATITLTDSYKKRLRNENGIPIRRSNETK